MSIELYADYLKEREDGHMIYDSHGFMSYFIKGDECYIRDVYIEPAFRKTHHATMFMLKVSSHAKQLGCKKLTGSVRPSSNGSTDSLKVLLSAGFKLWYSSQDAIFFFKELE